MAGTPKFKVHDEAGNYVAATVDAHLAAALIGAAGGNGWKVKYNGRIVWDEGAEFAWGEGAGSVRSAESIDHVAEIINDRIEERWRASQLLRGQLEAEGRFA